MLRGLLHHIICAIKHMNDEIRAACHARSASSIWATVSVGRAGFCSPCGVPCEGLLQAGHGRAGWRLCRGERMRKGKIKTATVPWTLIFKSSVNVVGTYCDAISKPGLNCERNQVLRNTLERIRTGSVACTKFSLKKQLQAVLSPCAQNKAQGAS